MWQPELQLKLPRWSILLLAVAFITLTLALPRTVSFWLLVVSAGVAFVPFVVLIRRWYLQWRAALRVRYASTRLPAGAVIVSAVFATMLLHPRTGGDYWYGAVIIAAVGIFFYSLRPLAIEQPEAAPGTFSAIGRKHMVAGGVGVLCLCLVLIRNLPAFWSATDALNIHWQHALLVGGLVLIAAGAGGWRPGAVRVHWLVWVALPIAAIALVVRVMQLNTHLPYMLEEWLFARPVGDMDSDTPLMYQISMFATSPRIYVYWQKLTAGWYGVDLAGLRIVSAVMGTVSVLVTGFLSHELFGGGKQGRWITIVAMLLMITYPVHLHYSRLGLFNIMDAILPALAFALLLRGLRLDCRVSFALAGLTLGLTHYFYEVMKVMTIPLVVLWLLAIVTISDNRRVNWRGVGVMVVVAAVAVILPWTIDSFTEVNSLARMDASSVLFASGWTFMDKLFFIPGMLRPALTTLTTHGDLKIDYFGTDQGLITVPMLPFFIVGVMLLSGRVRQRSSLLLLLLLAATIGANTLVKAIITPRYPIVFPVVVILTAAGIVIPATALLRRWPARVLMVAVTVAVAIWHFGWYWYTVVPERIENHYALTRENNHYSSMDIAVRLQGMPDTTTVHVFAYDHVSVLDDIIDYYNPEIHVRRVDMQRDNIMDWMEYNFIESRGHVILLHDGDHLTKYFIEQFFVLSDPIYSDGDVPDDLKMVMYYVMGHAAPPPYTAQ